MNPYVITLAEHLGVPLHPRSPLDGYAYDGRSIATGARDDSAVIHDLAHWVVAAKRRRRVREFGLGNAPDSRKDAAPEVSLPATEREEELASMLGIMIERAMGMPWRETLDDHSRLTRIDKGNAPTWTHASDASVLEQIAKLEPTRKLVARGLLDARLTPTMLPGAWS